MEMNAPITLEMKVYATNDEGTTAILTINLPRGRWLTPEQIKGFVKQAEDHLPDGYTLMNKRDFFNALLQEMHPGSDRFAVPGSQDFIDEVIEDATDE